MLVLEIALGVFLGLAAWRFRAPLLIVGMTIAGGAVWSLCGLALYQHGPPHKGDSLIVVGLWLGAWCLGGWLLGPAASLIGMWVAYRQPMHARRVVGQDGQHVDIDTDSGASRTFISVPMILILIMAAVLVLSIVLVAS